MPSLARPRQRLAVCIILFLVLCTCALPKNSHTHLTGFGCHSASKSIFADETLPPATSTTNHTLWVSQTPEGLLFRSENETVCVSMDSEGGAWKASPCKPTKKKSKEWLPIEGIYGVYNVPSGTIWVLITSSDEVYENDYYDIRRVHGLELVLVPNTKQQLSQRQLKEQARQVRLLRQALRHHNFYFSKGGADMTHTLQRSVLWQQQQHPKEKTCLPDSRFFWNEPCSQYIMEKVDDASKLLRRHVIPVTSAFVGVQANVAFCKDSKYCYDEVLISRRSRFRAGTRFTKRGADGTGAVANYAETEQVCWLKQHDKLKQVSSHVQTRGSVPLRWSSPADVKTYRPRVIIGTDPLAQARAVHSHLVGEFSRYVVAVNPTPYKHPQLVFVNLIDKKQDQGRLGRSFEAVLQAVLDLYNATDAVEEERQLPPSSVQHVWFDFHAEVKHGNWERLGSLLNDMKPTLEEQGYFCAAPESDGMWSVLRTQRGVIRTNCMDCLDRTNVVQSIFGRYMLYEQLAGVWNDKKRVLPAEYTKSFHRNSLTLPWNSGEVSHRLLWADNADAISRLYAGTPALKGDFTRTGKRTKKGALDDGMNSLQRYYLNNFLDADRQEGMDLMVGYADFSMDDSVDPDSLQEMARSLLLSSSDETRFAKRRRIAASRGLEMRWLPGDLQSHMKSYAWGVNKETKETLEAMEQRAASDAPWWVAEETSSDEDRDDDETVARTSVNTGHLIGAIVAALQAPGVTAAAVVCMLGFSGTDKKGADKKEAKK